MGGSGKQHCLPVTEQGAPEYAGCSGFAVPGGSGRRKSATRGPSDSQQWVKPPINPFHRRPREPLSTKIRTDFSECSVGSGPGNERVSAVVRRCDGVCGQVPRGTRLSPSALSFRISLCTQSQPVHVDAGMDAARAAASDRSPCHPFPPA